MNQKEYDVIVLGGNQAGVDTAIATAQNGLKTAIIEENQVGGSLFQTSQRPIELLLENNKFLKNCLESKKNGLVFSDISFDPNAFFEEISEEAEDLSETLIEKLKANDVDIYIGHGLVRPDNTVAVLREDTNTRVLNWKNLVYAGDPVVAIPPVIRSNSDHFFTTNNIGLLDYIPNGLIIYGSGFKAVNVADIWSSLGCKIYLICPDKEVLPNLPKEVSDEVLKILKEQGVEIFTDIDILDLYQDSEGDYHFEIINNETNQQKRIIGRELVVITKEGTSLTGIETLNIDQENGWLKTDDHLATSYDGIYSWTGSQFNERSPETDRQAADFLGKYLSGKTDEFFKHEPPEVILEFHPSYIKSGNTQEDEKVSKGTYSEGEEFFSIFIDKDYGRIVGAEIFHNEARELLEQLDFLSKLEISAHDLLDLKNVSGLNEIIVKATKDALEKDE